MKVLVVDDTAAVRAVLVAFFRAEMPDAEVIQARDSSEAVRLAGVFRFDLAVTDLWMPGGGGVEVLRLLGAGQGGVPCIVLSGSRDAALISAARREGARVVLKKPVGRGALRAAVQAALSAAPGEAC